jgi:hypothetical protein
MAAAVLETACLYLLNTPGFCNTFSDALRAVVEASGGQKLIMSLIVDSRQVGYGCRLRPSG